MPEDQMGLPRSKTRTTRETKTGTRASRPKKNPFELTISRHPLQYRWAAAISEEEWGIYRKAMETVRATGVDFMLGGGFAFAAYTGRWRDTKDIDFYILPGDRQKVSQALVAAGFKDYFGVKTYDRNWIYRSVQNNVIVDIIWSMANQRAQVDEQWFRRASEMALRRQHLKVVPREEFIWSKLYIVQRDHCDWTDVFNMVFVNGPEIDWDHLIERLEEDVPLLRSLLTMYAWLCPREVLNLPDTLWSRLEMQPPSPATHLKRDRIRLLDSRHWFVGLEREGNRLDV